MAANVESMFYVRETPWHGLGTMVEDAPTSADALHLAGLDWGVIQTPAYIKCDDVDKDTGFKVNIRNTDNSILGFVTDQYKVVQNIEAFEFTDSLIDGEVRYETAGSLADGKMVWLLARLPETEVLGDKMENYFLFSNAHDGTAAVRCTITPVRVVCQNTLNIALNNADRTWSFAHKGNIKGKLEEVKQCLRMGEHYQNEFMKKANELAIKRFTANELQNIINLLFPIEEKDGKYTQIKLHNMMKQREQFITAMNADDLQNFKGTAWGVLNAMSDFVYHAVPLRETKTYRENKVKQVIMGNQLFDRAYKILSAA